MASLKSTKRQPHGYVYFIHLCPNGPIKIGTTKDGGLAATGRKRKLTPRKNF